MKLEFNNFVAKDLELNAADDGKMTVSGYASIFGNLNSYGYTFDKGAFSGSLKDKEIRFLFNHNHDFVIGKILDAFEDEKGLFFKAEFLSGVQQSVEVYQMLKQGAINGVSIGFITISENSVNGVIHKTEVDLWEISIVTFPANDKATVQQVNAANSSTETLTDDEIVALHNSVQQLSKSVKDLQKVFC